MSCTLIHGDCLVEMDKLIRGGAKSGFNLNGFALWYYCM